MKKLLLCTLAVFAFAACSSTDEAADTTETPQAVAETPAAAEPAPAPAPAPETDTTMTNTSVDFPPITGTERSSSSCSANGDTRKVAVLDIADNGGCGVVYSKFSVDKTVAMAKHDMSFCDKVSSNIKTNLETAGYDCGGGSSAPAESSSSDQ